jgi:ferric-dicitrate binding protein FerR (iron transport regulator)
VSGEGDMRKHFREDEPSPAQLRQEWAAIEARLRTGRFRTVRKVAWGGGVLALAGAALVLVVPRLSSPPLVAEGASVAGTSLPESKLADGSRVSLSPAASAIVTSSRTDRVGIELLAGEGTFDVAKRPDRIFAVRAHGVEIRVVGTRFRVAVSQHEGSTTVTTTVERGVVEVRGPGQSTGQRLTVGQS